jgi:hypothetical protein
MADHLGHVTDAECIADRRADPVRVRDLVLNVDVSSGVVAAEARTSVAAAIMLDVRALHSTIAAGVEPVGDGARTVEPGIIDISNRAISESGEICRTVMGGDVDV